MGAEMPDTKVERCKTEAVEILGELAGLYCAGGDILLREALDRLSDANVIDTAARLRTVAHRLLGRGPSVSL